MIKAAQSISGARLAREAALTEAPPPRAMRQPRGRTRAAKRHSGTANLPIPNLTLPPATSSSSLSRRRSSWRQCQQVPWLLGWLRLLPCVVCSPAQTMFARSSSATSPGREGASPQGRRPWALASSAPSWASACLEERPRPWRVRRQTPRDAVAAEAEEPSATCLLRRWGAHRARVGSQT